MNIIENNKQIESKEITEYKPYVVSEDIGLLLQQWCNKKGFIMPEQYFIANLRNKFNCYMQNIFSIFDSVPEKEIVEGLTTLVKQTHLYPLSLDRVYFQSSSYLDITRLVDEKGNDAGLGKRSDYESLLNQFKNLDKIGLTNIVLVDDVLYSGGLLKRIIHLLNKMNINVPIVCSGIAIKEGVEKINNIGTEVFAVRTYNQVIDEVCERDFYPGTPFSGRSVSVIENTGAPYILPFGNPLNWASIPEYNQIDFSRFCLTQSIALFEEIEFSSKKTIQCCDIDRNVIGLPNNNSRFVDVLKTTMYNL